MIRTFAINWLFLG